MFSRVIFWGILGLGLAWGGTAAAHAPRVEVVSPSGPVFSKRFPLATTVYVNLVHASLTDLGRLLVETENAELLRAKRLFVASPGTLSCHADLAGRDRGGCTVHSSDSATVAVAWEIEAPGTRVLSLEISHATSDEAYAGATTGSVTVVVQQAIDFDYPRPPTIASNYINRDDTLSAMMHGGTRACILSRITALHDESRYGEEGAGPYDESLVMADVQEFLGDAIWRFAAGGEGTQEKRGPPNRPPLEPMA